MSQRALYLLAFAPAALLGCRGPSGTGAAGGGGRPPDAVPHVAREDDWVTFTHPRWHFHLRHPPTWKINPEPAVVAHYSDVLVTLNDAGKERLIVREMETKQNTWELSPNTISRQVPPQHAYISIGLQDGPGGLPQFGPRVTEMVAADLSGPLAQSREEQSADLVTRQIDFWKWGRCWQITVYMHAPVPAALRDEVRRILESFRFDGVPAGDEVWALGLAHKKLPPEAEPQMYSRQGGSSEYYCSAKAEGEEVLVTFTKHLSDAPPKRWKYRVTATGEVLPLPSE